MNESTTKPVELEIEFPKTACAEWIPLLVKVKRPDSWPSGIAVRNVSTADKSVQIDLDFLDRDISFDQVSNTASRSQSKCQTSGIWCQTFSRFRFTKKTPIQKTIRRFRCQRKK